MQNQNQNQMSYSSYNALMNANKNKPLDQLNQQMRFPTNSPII